MTAIFTGLGAGLERSSASVLGGSGVLGSGVVGRGGEGVSVNAATGNLLISQQDEFLTGRGLDVGISRTYNSLAELSDGDNNDNWQMSTVRRVFFDSVTDTVKRQSGDGSAITYSWDGSVYRTTDGEGAYDTLTKVGATWVWKDGSSQITETYAEYPAGSDQFRITKQTDIDNNGLTFTYTGDLLDKVTTANGEWVQYSWSGTNLTKLVTGDSGSTLTRTWYEYSSGKLSRVRVDLTPTDNVAPTDAQSYWTAYGYDGAGRVNLITQKDGSQVDVTYDGTGRVSSVTQTAAAGDTRVTSLVYGTGYTEVTGPDGQVTRLDYVAVSQNPVNLLDPVITNWNKSAVTQVVDTGTYVDGHSVYEVSADLGAASSRISAGNVAATPGETYTFTISLQAGSTPPVSQRFRFSTNTGGTPIVSGAILDGPGQFVQESPGSLFWRLTGLSSTQVTRVEFSGTIDSAGSAGNANAIIYSYYGGSFAAGEEILVHNATFYEGTIAAGGPTVNAGQLTKITAPPAYAGAAAQVAEFAYDTDGNLLNTTAPGGGVTTYLFDANGNVTKATSPDGKTVENWYDSGNRLIKTRTYGSNWSSANVAQYTRNAYDSEGHLRYSVSSEGHVTEYRYSGPGLLQFIVEYPEHDYPTGSGVIDEASMDAWRDAIVDRSSIKIMRYNHDSRGNQSWALNYGSANTDGSQSSAEGYSRTYFTYDQAGRLLSRYNHSEAAETFTYDGMGRLTASTNTAGGTTSIVFDDVNTTTVVTTASSYVTTQTYNKVGELISSMSSGNEDVTGTSTYQYDKNGQLKVSTDETGYKSYYIYDQVGRKVADVNHYGQLTEYRYDADNRVIATTSYYNAMSAAKLALAADPAGTPEMSALRPTASTAYDIWTWTVYDADGQVVQSIDGAGSVTGFEYDNSGRLVKTIAYATSVAVAAYKTTPPTAPVTVTTDAADSINRTFYNRDGHMIGALDGEGYLTENVYDEAGQLIEEVAYATQTSSGLWASGTFNQLRSDAGTGNAANRRAHNVYDGQGQLRYSIDNAGQVTGFTYNKAGKLTKTVSYAATTSPADYTYDAVKAAVVTTGSADRSVTLAYDSEGRVSTSTDAVGTVTTFTYDSSNRVIKSEVGTGAAARITRNYYTAGGLPRFTVDAEGYARRFDYDEAGRTIREVVWDAPISTGDTTTIANVHTLLPTATAANSTDQRWEYDSAGRVSSSYDGLGTRTYYTYYGNGQVKDTYYAYGTADQSQAHFIYDGAGRVTHEYAAYGETATQANGAPGEQVLVTHAYNGLSERISTTDARGLVTTFAYDERGQMVSSTDADNGVTAFEYNAFGEVTRTVDPRGFETLSTYNTLGQLTQTTDALNIDTDYTYTQFGELATVTKAGAVTSFTYDKLGRALTSTDAMTFVETYTYDAYGNRASMTNKLGGTTTYTYDKRGQLISETLPMVAYDDAGNANSNPVVNTYSYDARGNQIQMIEADGLPESRTTSFEYDNANRLIQTTGQARDVWDQSTHALAQANHIPTEELHYDARGNVTKTIDANGNRTVHFYDDLNRKTVEIDALGTYTAYTYDENGNVEDIKVYETQLTTIPTDGGSQEEQPTVPSGSFRETSFTYDDLNRMVTSTVELDSATKIGNWNGSTTSPAWTSSTPGALTTTYEYDANGNVVKTTDPNGNDTFAYYDDLSRKTLQIDNDGYITKWEYNSEGNVTEETVFATQYTGTPNTSTAPSVSTNSADRITQYTYDLVGNRLTEARKDVLVHNGSGAQTNQTWVTVSYTYNGLGQVLVKTEATNDEITYTYDDGGRLESEQRDSYAGHTGANVTPEIDYYYDGLGNLTRTEAAGAAGVLARVSQYEYGAGGLLSKVTDAEGHAHEYFYDKLGRQIVDQYERTESDGTTVHTEASLTSYDALGRAIEQTVATQNGANWTKGDISHSEYDAFGDMIASGINKTASASTTWQTRNKFDEAGRLYATNAGDGVWKFFGYDANGNQTAAITSAGYDFASLTAQTFSAALTKVGQADVNATYTGYDARNLATEVVEEGRELSSTSSNNTLTTSRIYNAFGEVISETDALGSLLSYTYNNAGKLIRSESPTVEITNEDGTSQWVKPSEDYYYDASGRLVATRDANGTYVGGTNAGNASSKADDTGNLTQLTLLTGTGYGGNQALVTSTTDAGGGVKTTKYDIHGDARTMISELGFETLHTYDKLGRLVERIEVRGAGSGDDLEDYYAYDGLGQQIKHSNNFYSTDETTDYDLQGRVTSSVAFGGDETEITYEWDDNLVTAGLGTFGGWTQETTYENNRTLTEKSDLFGRQTYKDDLGSNVTNYTYDVAGRLVSTSVGTSFVWLNTGQVGHMSQTTVSIDDIYHNFGGGTPVLIGTDTTTADVGADYIYDAIGNRLSEYGETVTVKSFQSVGGGSPHVTTTTTSWKDQTATYDALGRLKAWAEAGTDISPAASITNKYDAAGNIRHTHSQHYELSSTGAATTQKTRDHWFRFDAMHRVVVSEGVMENGVITAGESTATVPAGRDITYNVGGQRTSVTNSYIDVYGTTTTKELYTYDEAGRLIETQEANNANATTGTIRSDYAYNKIGQQTLQQDYNAAGTQVVFSRSAAYNIKGQLASDSTSTKKTDNKTYTTATTYHMTDKASPNEYLLGAVGWQSTVNGVTGQANTTSETVTTYDWYDGAMQAEIEYDADVNSGSNLVYHTYFTYNDQGQLTKADINDGKQHDANFTLDELGQVIAREETSVSGQTGAPHEVWYRFGGRELGYTGNNGTSDMAMSASIDERQEVTPSNQGTFRNKQMTGTSYADFAQAYDPLNSYNQGSSSGSYTVRSGDSLQSIAQGLYGDSGLWYKIAEVNGLSAYSGLTEGQRLTLPTGVMNATHNASSFAAYDPSSTLGDVNPSTNPTPQKGKKGCGVFGQILLAVVAIAVTVLLTPASGATFGQVLVGAIGGNVASQAVGLATGIQDKFSFKSLAVTALTAGVTAGLGDKGIGAFSKIGISGGSGFSGVVNAAARGAISSGISQGIATATGLQEKFSWAGVAAAGIGAGLSHAAGAALASDKGLFGIKASAGSFGNSLGAAAASSIANAATRSAINGNSFGDNLVAAIPDIIGQAVGGALGRAASDALGKRGEPINLLEGTPYDISPAIQKPEQQIASNPVATGGGGGGGRIIGNGKLQYRSSSLFPSYLDGFPFNAWETPTAHFGGSVGGFLSELREMGSGAFGGLLEWGEEQLDNVRTFDFNEIVVTAERIYESPLVQHAIHQTVNIPIVRNALLLNAAAQQVAPYTNQASAAVSGLGESYLARSEALRSSSVLYAPVLNQLDAGAGAVTGLAQGILGIPQVAADPLGAGKGLANTVSNGVGFVTSHSVGELTSMGYNKLASTSTSRMFFTGGEVGSAFIPAAGVTKVGLLGRTGRIAGAVERGGGAATAGRTYSGGAYGRLSAQKGVIERHHAPADSVSPYTTYSGPAIQMDYADHLLTSSHGGGLRSALYRTEVQQLIDAGNMRGAMAKEVWDIRRVSVQSSGSTTKYNAATREMLDYAYGQGYLNKVP